MNTLLSQNNATYFSHQRKEMLDFIPSGITSILDVGCGNGAFLENFANKGIYTAGIEPNIGAAAIAKTKANLIINSKFDSLSVDEIKCKNLTFDCIFFNDVLEHLYDPWDAIRLARTLLSPIGVIITSIPNILYYSNIWYIIQNQDFKYCDAGLMDITHIRFFTRKSASRMFEEEDYEILKIEGICAIKSTKFKLVNFLLANKIKDWQFMQFVIVAKPK